MAKTRFPLAMLIAIAVAITTAGCRTTRNADGKPDRTKDGLGSSTTKTDFSREATPDQGFNMHMELARVRAAESNFEAAANENLLALEILEKRGSLLSGVGAKLGPEKRALAHRRAAESYDQLGRFAEAGVHYAKALKLAPSDPKVWNSVGYSYYLQNRLADAERTLKTAAKFDPNDPKIQTNLGLALAAAGKTDAALAALTKAGGPAVGHANLGFILAAMGKTEEARTQYHSALVLQPSLAPAQMALAQLDPAKLDQAVAIASVTNELPRSKPAPTPGPIQVQPPLQVPVSADVPAPVARPVPIPIPIPIPVPVAPLPPITSPSAPPIAETEIPKLPDTLELKAAVPASKPIETPSKPATPKRGLRFRSEPRKKLTDGTTPPPQTSPTGTNAIPPTPW